jgi:hypothetical protein
MKKTIMIMVGLIFLTFSVESIAKELENSKGVNVPPIAVQANSSTKLFDDFQIHFSLDFVGPILFTDTSDQDNDELNVFSYGAGFAFLLGNSSKDLHRFGLGATFNHVARTEERRLDRSTQYFVYETGYPLILQVRLGYALAMGTDEFKESYTGPYGGVTLKYEFNKDNSSSSFSTALGLSADLVWSKHLPEYTTVFVGLKLEIIYHK